MEHLVLNQNCTAGVFFFVSVNPNCNLSVLLFLWLLLFSCNVEGESLLWYRFWCTSMCQRIYLLLSNVKWPFVVKTGFIHAAPFPLFFLDAAEIGKSQTKKKQYLKLQFYMGILQISWLGTGSMFKHVWCMTQGLGRKFKILIIPV